ncbi:pyruvate dehydrogenase E2 component [Ardenticatena maritima]|uniref:Dihydrolipoamide acetyltransferase component of pyruvate dehydrogenase complex n=2 Tax=Ardenticatena maritima TaxID=872965 RepID=A0A0M9UBT0_9CHLR|nr:2-oxo acid dehydrogenase subunit E2 [Ardenticatena maritima]GAP62107.1 pyruvate dehydrogenase E2 component [Ardenticatena maritima]
MAVELTLPKLGFDMEEGAIAAWLKNEGDPVKKGEVVAEVETDKATVEMEAPADGVLLKILVPAGQVVPVNTPVALIGEPGEAVETAAAPTPAVAEETAPTPEPAPASAPAVAPAEEVKATPVARRLAEEHGVDLSRVQGTGPGGRITKEDVQAHLEQADEPPPPDGVKASPAARRRARELGVDIRQVPGSGPDGRIVIRDVEAFAERAAAVVETPAPAPTPAPTAPTAPVVPVQPIGAAEEIPLTRMRQRIAEVMTASKAPVPHFYVTMSIDMDAAMALRQQINATLADEGIKVSVNDMIVKAAALALRKFPNINASFAGDKIIRHGDVNVGIAVAVESGLLTVVVRNADQKSLSQIAAEARAKVQRAREGKVQPDDIGGSTFTVSNLGMYGVDSFVAVITPPEAAILAVGGVQKVPVVRNDEIVVGQVLKVTLSADHRVTDGAEAAEFLVEFKRLLENPMRLML